MTVQNASLFGRRFLFKVTEVDRGLNLQSGRTVATAVVRLPQLHHPSLERAKQSTRCLGGNRDKRVGHRCYRENDLHQTEGERSLPAGGSRKRRPASSRTFSCRSSGAFPSARRPQMASSAMSVRWAVSFALPGRERRRVRCIGILAYSSHAQA